MSYLTSIWDNVGEVSAACVSPEQTGATGDGDSGHLVTATTRATAHPGLAGADPWPASLSCTFPVL